MEAVEHCRKLESKETPKVSHMYKYIMYWSYRDPYLIANPNLICTGGLLYVYNMILFPVILCTCMVLLPSCHAWTSTWRTEIIVRPPSSPHEAAVHDNTSCCSPNVTKTRMVCTSINEALSCLQITGNSTVIYIEEGMYLLTNGSETRIQYMSDVAIIGASYDSVTIACDTPAGLAFVQSTRISLTNFALQNCSMLQNSTSLNYTKKPMQIPFDFICYNVTIYVLMCTDLTIHQVIIGENHAGTGMTLYNVAGTVNITNSTFVQNRGRPGGGGLQIEFSYCIPGDLSCQYSHVTQIEPRYSSDSTYFITDCVFRDNIGYRGYSGLRKVPNVGKETFSFGRGGGLSVIFKGTASNNVFIISNSEMLNNIAHMGGGIYSSFHDDASNNRLIVKEVLFEMNQVVEIVHTVYDVDGGGGGMKVILDNGEHGKSSNNTIVISACNFVNNEAMIGAGLWVENNLNSFTTGDSVSIENSKFYHNTAFLGSAIYLSSNFEKTTTKTSLSNLNVSSNLLKCSETVTYTFLPCSGIIYSVNVPFNLNGSNTFYNNSASGIETHETVITVHEEAHLYFDSNVSPYGPGLALYDCSYMVLTENTSLLFFNNTALKLGGAIYADSCSGGIQPAVASSECFIQYYDKTLHPDYWKTNLTFIDNRDRTGNNSLFAVSLSACWWPKVNATFIYTSFNDFDALRDTFCWKSWHYDSALTDENYCEFEVRSGPALLRFNNLISPMSIYPGAYIGIPEVQDGKLRPMMDVLQACIAYGPASFSRDFFKQCQNHHNGSHLYLYQYGIHGEPNMISSSTVHITIEIVNAGPGALFKPSLDVHFTKCPVPFILPNNNSVCLYRFNYFACDKSYAGLCEIGSDVTPLPYYCVTNLSASAVVIGLCPLSYNGLPSYNYISGNISGSDCAHGHTGRLCGACKTDYCVPVNSFRYDCMDSTSKTSIPGSLLFIILQIIPVSVMIFFVIALNIDLTQGYMIGFVFYCQIISLNFPIWIYPTWFAGKLYHPDSPIFKVKYDTAPYRIFNLDFLTVYDCETLPICITKHMDAMGVIGFSYVVPFYCILAILLVTVWLTMYERGRPCVVQVTRPIHRCFARIWRKLNIKPSFLNSFASLYILCFTPMAATSFKLLHYVTWQNLEVAESEGGKAFFYDAEYEYFGYPHCFLALLALFVLLFLCILPAVFLVLYPYEIFHRILNRLKLRRQTFIAYADVHTAAFCNGLKGTKDFRSFAGFYLLLRLVIMCFYYIPGHFYIDILILEIIISFVFGGVIMIFRPFKQAFVNFINFLIFVLLGGMSVVCLTLKTKGRSANLHFIIHLPLLTLIIYLVYRLCKWSYKQSCCVCRNKPSKKTFFTEYESTTVADAMSQIESEDISKGIQADLYTDDSLPDRIENPNNYSRLIPPNQAPQLPQQPQGSGRFSTDHTTPQHVRMTRTTSIGGKRKKKDYGTY